MKTGRTPKALEDKKIQITTNRCVTPQEFKSHGWIEALKIKMKNKVLEI